MLSTNNLTIGYLNHVRPHQLYIYIVKQRISFNNCLSLSEAILALQSEVANLKRELEERLSHLPHFSRQVAQASHTRPRQERRPKGRPRPHHRPSSSRYTVQQAHITGSTVACMYVKHTDLFCAQLSCTGMRYNKHYDFR